MPLILQEINDETDFPALANCLFETYENPPQNFFHIWFPILGYSNEAREAAIKECAERLKLWNNHDPSTSWRKVVDTETGEIAGGVTWKTNFSNPFAEAKPVSAYWFPDDGSRKWVEEAITPFATPRVQHVSKPHQYLFIIFTHPSYRRRGVGQLLLDACLADAKVHGLDTYLDATPLGRPLYEANRFHYIQENVSAPKTDNADPEWKDMDNKVGPFTFWLMVKPFEEYNIDE